MRFLERLRQERRARENHIQPCDVQGRDEREKAEAKRKKKEDLNAARAFLQESGLFPILQTAARELKESRYGCNFAELEVVESLDSSTIDLNLHFGNKETKSPGLDHFSVIVSFSHDGRVGFKSLPDCIYDYNTQRRISPKKSFTLEEWCNNKRILEDALWLAYQHHGDGVNFKEEAKKLEKLRRYQERYPSPPDFSGR